MPAQFLAQPVSDLQEFVLYDLGEMGDINIIGYNTTIRAPCVSALSIRFLGRAVYVQEGRECVQQG